MLTIDGSMGEGGGQVLRTALGLSLATGMPFRIERIRGNRGRPGLLPQHLAAVRAAAAVGSAEVEGDTIGSSSLVFRPQVVRGGSHRFVVGTAGSATLVLQTVLPALCAAQQGATLELEGGTHNPLAPPFDFLAASFLPVFQRMGVPVSARLERCGFFPRGGGRFVVSLAPAGLWQPIDIVARGALRSRGARAIVSRLPDHIALRELAVVAAELGWPTECLRSERVPDSSGPGNVLILELACDHVVEVVTGFGARGVTAEEVAHRAVAEARRYLQGTPPVGTHLADQLLVPFALVGGGSFRTFDLSVHATTNIDVIRHFLPVRFQVTRLAADDVLVEVFQGDR